MPKLLLVEDEVDLREAMAEEIADEGYDIQVAQNGLKALEKLADFTPDVIVSDISMPEMDGFELLENIRKSFAHLDDVPFIFLSAFNAKDDVVKGKKLGADDYLVKPVDFDMLFATLDSRLQQVQRMIDRKEKQFVKLYHTLQSENQKRTEAEVQSAMPQEPVAPEEVRVFGRCLHYEGMIPPFNRFNQNKEISLDDVVLSNMETIIPPEIELDSNIPGIIFMYGAMPNSKFKLGDGLDLDLMIQRKVFEHDAGQTITTNFHQLVLGKDLRVRDIPFDTAIPEEVMDDPKERTTALLQVLRDRYSDKEFLQQKMKNIRSVCSLSEASFKVKSDKVQNLHFFYMDDTSKNLLQAAKAFCCANNQKAIEFLRDVMYLDLIQEQVATITDGALLVVDIHFDTISKPEKLAQYRRKYESVFADAFDKVCLSVRGLPHNIDLAKCSSMIANAPIKKAEWIAQLNPWLDTGLEVDKLNAKSFVWSLADIYGTQPTLEHYKKQMRAYKLCGSSLLVRDVTPGADASLYEGFNFDGLSINDAG